MRTKPIRAKTEPTKHNRYKKRNRYKKEKTNAAR